MEGVKRFGTDVNQSVEQEALNVSKFDPEMAKITKLRTLKARA